jgi:hypothetical protein
MPGRLARPPCPAALPENFARQLCPATLPGSLARQPCPAALPGSLARQPCPADLPGSLALAALQKYFNLITGHRPAGRIAIPFVLQASKIVQIHNVTKKPAKIYVLSLHNF